MFRSNPTADLVANVECEIGENPLWHQELQNVLFLDIAAGIVHRFDPSTQACSPFARTRTTGGLTLQGDGSVLLFQDGRIAILSLQGEMHEVREGLCPGNDRFNDAIADPEGRVFAGVLGQNGKLIRFNLDGTFTEIFDGLGIPNGMGFTPDLTGMYFTDSKPGLIYYFDYDRQTGNLTNQRVFAEIPREEGVPDGMTVDSEGCIWTAIWFGGRIRRYSPDGTLDRELFLPVKQTSAVCFGGPDFGDLYVTSAASNAGDSLLTSGYKWNAPRGGGLYQIKMSGVRGIAPFRSRLPFS